MVLELWGSGFNAYSQLLFDDDPFPDDILTPTLLATAKVSLEPLFIGWSDLGRGFPTPIQKATIESNILTIRILSKLR